MQQTRTDNREDTTALDLGTAVMVLVMMASLVSIAFLAR